MKTQLDELWTQMSETPAPVGSVKRLLSAEWPGELSAVVIKPENQHALLLEIEQSVRIDIDSLAKSDAIELTTSGGSEGVTAIQLTLADPKFADTFLTLAADLADKVLATSSEVDGALALVHNLTRWLRFLKRRSPGVLTREQQIGLYGELSTLEDLFAPALGYSEAVRGWVGPHGSYQDFEFGSVAVEVKTLSATQPQQLKIETERQLDDRGLSALVAAHHKIDRKQDVGRSLPDVVALIRQGLEGVGSAAEEFEDLLFEVGYLEIHAHLYGQHGYVDRGSQYYRVAHGFPRIVEDDLIPGVGHVRYKIDASACVPFEIEPEQVAMWIGDAPSVSDPVGEPESQHLEFKESGWVSGNPDIPPKVINTEIVKTVAGFLNSEGGTLVIGLIDRTEQVAGIEADLDHLGTDADGYENRLTTLVTSSLGRSAAANTRVTFDKREGGTLCLVRVRPSARAVFADPPTKGGNVFWVRVNNSTREFAGADMVNYIRDHWG